MEEDAYTAPQAARVLGLSDRRVRQMLEAGEIEGARDDSGKWWVAQRVVHEALESRGSPRGAGRRPSPTSSEGAGEPSSTPPEGAPDPHQSLRELMSRVEDLSYRLGRSEARAEITERAESSLREERDRLLRELEEERAERRRLAERQARLEEERRDPTPPPAPPEAGSPEDFPQPAPSEEDVGRPPRWWKRIFR